MSPNTYEAVDDLESPKPTARSSIVTVSPPFDGSTTPSSRLSSSRPSFVATSPQQHPVYRSSIARASTQDFTESDHFLEPPTADSTTTSRRESYAGDVPLKEFSSGFPFPARKDGERPLSNLFPSYPGTPMSGSSLNPDQFGRASPVALSWAKSPYDSNVSFRQSRQSLMRMFPETDSVYYDKEWVKKGVIAKIHRRDDKEEWPTWKRRLYYSVPFLAIATLGTYWAYFILRILCVISAQRQEGRSFPMAWVFVGIEISVAIPTFLQLFWSVFVLKKRNRPKLRLVGNDVPTVDVFITCCGEDVDLVMDTALAACDLDYPQDRFRVVILDDANDVKLMEAIESLNAKYPNVAYRCRPKFPGVPHHFKAGNLNYGIEAVTDMPGGASRYIAALDADMIPEQHWLRAIMPHMLEDDKLALACPPQLFYNVPAGDPLSQSLDFFVHVSEPVKDALGVAWCTGSGYIVRRDALEEIGFFPQGSLAEDVATSTLLLGRGWKCAYIHEPLQFGTVPDSFGSHLKQRTRWAIGTVDTSFKLRFCLWGKDIKQLTFYQRMSSFIYAILSLYNIFLTLSLFALPLVLISGNRLIAYANDNQLRWLIRACFIALATNRVCELALFLPSGYATGQRGSRAQLWMAPYVTLSILRSFVLPTWLGGQKQAFKPSGSLKSELNERDPKHRAGVFRRLWVIAINYMAGYHILYVYLVLAAVTLTTLRCIFDEKTTQEKLICLLTHAFWPPISWILTLSAFWTPISYALDPPSVPDREALLQRDPKTGIAHPTKQSKKTAFKPETLFFEFEYLLSTAFTIIVFVASFTVKIA
ncbi:hypothetical protein LTR85_007654 [Meristemomyces frigidus]|nr:hypothetical protein LTR85_007654 [Meristemomyces frigidus]